MNEQQVLANCTDALRRVYPRFDINFCYCIEELVDFTMIDKNVWYKYPHYKAYTPRPNKERFVEGYLYTADITIYVPDGSSLHAIAIIQQYKMEEAQDWYQFETRVYYIKKDLDSCGTQQSMSADGQHTTYQNMTNQGFLQYGTTKENI